MLKFNKILAPLAVSISLTFTSSSFAGSDHHPRKNQFRQILKQLDLSQTQVQDVRQLMKQGHEDKSVYRLDMRGISSQLKTLIQNTAWDQQAIETVLLQRMDLIAQIGWQKAAKKNQVWQLLTSQQQSELVQLVEQQDNKKHKHHRSFKFLKTLDLSDEQAVEIKKIKANFETITANLKAKRQEFRREQLTLIRSENLAPNEWQALEVKYQDDFLAMATAKAQTRHSIWNLLNTEQQTQLREKKQQRQQKRQEHNEGHL
jgi:Spy/CpxP family protein refolding chaperone